MEIIDIISQSAQMLNLTTEVSLLNSTTEENEATALANDNVKTLFNLVKFSIQELCTNYIFVSTKQSVTTTDKVYALSNLENCIRVQSVYKDGNKIKYKIVNRNICFDEDGNYIVEYLTYPDIDSLFDEFDFLSTLSPDVLVFGLCSYYCITKGLFDEFKIYHDLYLNRAESLKDLKVFDMPQRRWE